MDPKFDIQKWFGKYSSIQRSCFTWFPVGRDPYISENSESKSRSGSVCCHCGSEQLHLTGHVSGSILDRSIDDRNGIGGHYSISPKGHKGNTIPTS